MAGLSKGYLAARFASDSWTVYGRRLRPFCIEFFEALAAVGSPLVSGDKSLVQPIDLWIAAEICAGRRLRLGRLGSGIAFRFRKWLHRFPVEYRNFLGYLDDHYTPPSVWQSEGSGARLGAPWTLSLESKMLEFTNMRSSEIRSMSLALVIWLSLAHAERHGGERFVSDEEQAILDMIERAKKGGGDD